MWSKTGVLNLQESKIWNQISQMKIREIAFQAKTLKLTLLYYILLEISNLRHTWKMYVYRWNLRSSIIFTMHSNKKEPFWNKIVCARWSLTLDLCWLYFLTKGKNQISRKCQLYREKILDLVDQPPKLYCNPI